MQSNVALTSHSPSWKQSFVIVWVNLILKNFNIKLKIYQKCLEGGEETRKCNEILSSSCGYNSF